MRRGKNEPKKGIITGTITLFIAAVSSVSYGQASQGELCKKMWDNFQGMRAMTGLSQASDEQFSKFSGFAKAIIADTKASSEKFANDKNYKVLNDEVLYHSTEIDKASGKKIWKKFRCNSEDLPLPAGIVIRFISQS